MKNHDTPRNPLLSRVCKHTATWVMPVALAAALSVSNGPAVGIGIGAALAVVMNLMNRR